MKQRPALTVICLLATVGTLWIVDREQPLLAQPHDKPSSPDATQASDEPSRVKLEYFEQHVRPLLAQRCFKCHGPDKQKGSLRLDSRASMLSGGDSGPAIAPGEPADSLLLEAVRYESFEMPPDGKLADSEIEVLNRWIELGAPWPGSDRDTQLRPGSKLTDEDRAYWFFQPLARVTPPRDTGGWSRNPIDAFIKRRLDEADLIPSPAAEPERLIRRVYFDLVGIPPTPEEVEKFVADPSDAAYRDLIDRLLDRSAYGERWARHWLDLVRYAESDGYKQDAFRPSAWRYRDYVIRSFNEDKPYDAFVQEQIAGDELFPDDPDARVATGYFRHGIYEYNQRDVRTQWDGMLNEITDVTADVFLGLGLQCARCHDHKFDPLLRDDYYRLRAFFEPLRLEDDSLVASPAEQQKYLWELAAWEMLADDVRDDLSEIEKPLLEAAASSSIEKFPKDVRPLLRKSPAERTPQEQQLAELAWRQVRTAMEGVKFESKLKGEQKENWLELQKALQEYRARAPQRPAVACTVCDVGREAPPTQVPGDRRNRVIDPGFPTVIAPGPADIESLPSQIPSTGRRASLARWLTRADNQLTTRVIVNRIWQFHFGRGLVATPSDFGRLGEPPSHPELLDWLARRFVEDGWSIKSLHRLILTSATYRQAAAGNAREAVAMRIDPQNRLLWKANIHRLAAEQIRDAMLAVSGELETREGGPSVDPQTPRRTVYTKVFRNERDPLLDVFDVPDAIASTPERNVTTTPLQALLMINGPWTLARARNLARRAAGVSEQPDEQVAWLYRTLFGRRPDAAEFAMVTEFLADYPRDAATPGAKLTALGDHDNSAIEISDAVEPWTAEGFSPDNGFTLEGTFQLRSLYEDASVRTLVAQWNSNAQSPGWSVGVTSRKSKYTPRNLILQLVGRDASESNRYEVIASDLLVELDTPYHFAVSVQLGETGEQGIQFRLTNLQTGEQRHATRAHQVTSIDPSPLAVTIGGRSGGKRHRWDGLLGELTIRDTADDTPSDAAEKVWAAWRFNAGHPLADAGPEGRHLVPLNSPANEPPIALVDLCHVLLNSNEFLYVE